MKVSAAKRSRARHYAMQAIYQWQMTSNPVFTIDAEFRVDNDMSKVDVDYFSQLLHGAVKQHSALDDIFMPFLTAKKKEELDPVTLALLRMATLEFQERLDVPYRVVINESVNLAKKFGAEDSHKFVNGVLDKVASKVREVEVAADKQSK